MGRSNGLFHPPLLSGSLKQAVKLVHGVTGSAPLVSWHHENPPEIHVESYFYVNQAEVAIPKLPIRVIAMLLDGRPVHNLPREPRAVAGMTPQPQFTTLANRFAILPGNRVSHWRMSPGGATIAVVYLPGYEQELLADLLEDDAVPVSLHDDLLVSLVRQMLRSASPEAPGDRNYRQALADAFVGQLAWLGANKARTLKNRRSTGSDFAIYKALSLIDQHLAEAVSIEWLCTQVNMTSTVFRERFHSVAGMPVHRYLVKRRLAMARELVDSTNLALSIIANQCGFSSQSHMTWAFKREFGITPSLLRRQSAGRQVPLR